MDPDVVGQMSQFSESTPATTLSADYMPELNATAAPDLANSTEGLNMTGANIDPQFFEFEDLDGVIIPTPVESNISSQMPHSRWCLPSDLGNIISFTIIFELFIVHLTQLSYLKHTFFHTKATIWLSSSSCSASGMDGF